MYYEIHDNSKIAFAADNGVFFFSNLRLCHRALLLVYLLPWKLDVVAWRETMCTDPVPSMPKKLNKTRMSALKAMVRRSWEPKQQEKIAIDVQEIHPRDIYHPRFCP